MKMPAQHDTAPAPWWRFPMVWLVFGGPATVVVAAIATAVVAFRDADPVVYDPAAPAADGPARPTAAALDARDRTPTPRP